jgi:hypothetical protein
MSLKSDNVEFVRYCGDHFENGDRQTFFNVGINSGHHYLPTYQILMISVIIRGAILCFQNFQDV